MSCFSARFTESGKGGRGNMLLKKESDEQQEKR